MMRCVHTQQLQARLKLVMHLRRPDVWESLTLRTSGGTLSDIFSPVFHNVVHVTVTWPDVTWRDLSIEAIAIFVLFNTGFILASLTHITKMNYTYDYDDDERGSVDDECTDYEIY